MPTSGSRTCSATPPQIYPYVGNPGWNLTTAMADDAIGYMKRINAIDPEQPFFLYYVPGGDRTRRTIRRRNGSRRSATCTCSTRAGTSCATQIFANQKKLGVIPQDAKLTPWPDDLLKQWDTLSADEKKLFIRQVDVFAAYLAYTDHEIGRVIQEVEDMGKLDNTLIIYIAGDNGNSAEGSLIGTPNEVASIQGVDVPVAGPAEVLTMPGGPTRPIRTWRCHGPGRSTRRFPGPSRSRRISAASARAWPSPGRR